jgi:hypothetical protein
MAKTITWRLPMCGLGFAETPFNYAYKGLKCTTTAQRGVGGSGAPGRVSPNLGFYKLGPGEYERCGRYDVLIFSL